MVLFFSTISLRALEACEDFASGFLLALRVIPIKCPRLGARSTCCEQYDGYETGTLENADIARPRGLVILEVVS